VTDIEHEAHKETHRAYPHRNPYLEGGAYMGEERSRIPLREAFATGYIAGASRPASPATREAVTAAVQKVLWNASNYPEPAQARMLGQDVTGLTAKVVDALAQFDIRERSE
jgi:hypothetical protein